METKTINDREGLLEDIRQARKIVLCAHVSPDGDTLGSSLAMRLALEKMGKQVWVICQDAVPGYLSFLPGAEKVQRPEALGPVHPELVLCVDVSDQRRLGSCIRVFEAAQHTAQVDHHGTNPYYAQRNLVSPSSSATGLVVWELIKQLGVTIDTDIARCLYTAVSTDTGNFSFNNTTAEAFLMMGELMLLPLPLAEMNRMLFRVRSKPQLLLLSRALDSLRFCAGDRIAYMSLSWKDFQDCGALPEHAEAIVNFALDVHGVRLAFLARETDMGDVKLSMRALAPAGWMALRRTWAAAVTPWLRAAPWKCPWSRRWSWCAAAWKRRWRKLWSKERPCERIYQYTQAPGHDLRRGGGHPAPPVRRGKGRPRGHPGPGGRRRAARDDGQGRAAF